MKREFCRVTVCGAILAFATAAQAQDNFETFKHLANGPAATENADAWGPVPTKKVSLVNLAPGLLPFFNNGPVFGIPGTDTSSFLHSTQLGGDWGGARTELARRGWFFDMYTTGVFQDVTSGGLETGDSFTQNVQYSVNLDTARAGLWSGGLFHFTAQSRYGDSVTDTFSAGTMLPQYMGLVHPGPQFPNRTYPTEYFLVQALSRKTSVVLGKISDIYIPDQTMFGSSYKYHFANFNFLKNPMTPNFYTPTAWSALGIWVPAKSLAVAGGVLDPNSQANNFASKIFDRVNIYTMAIGSYKVKGRPGQVGPAFNWSNKPKTDLNNPFSNLALQQIPQAVGSLLGVTSSAGLHTNTKTDSWFFLTNASQYIWMKDAPEALPGKLRSGQMLRGIGMFGRFGYAPDDTNTVTRDGSIALFGYGLMDSRRYDSFGTGFYYNNFSDPLKKDIALLTAGTSHMDDEKGVEAFYDFALTPAIRIIPSYQHIWNPMTAQVAKHQTDANIFLLRLTLAY